LNINLGATKGEKLHPGRYYDAERAAFRTGRAPGLDISGNGRGCNQIWGSFAISQIGVDGSGNVTMLDATFNQRCESATAPAFKGTIKFKAPLLSYAFTSESGDYSGLGQEKTYFGATATFSLTGTNLYVQYSVSGQRDNWTVLMSPPSGQQLKPGTYDTARFADSNYARLDVFGNGRGCNGSTGTLTINAITFDTSNNVTSLSASFEQHCEGSAAALRGTIHYYR